MNCANHADASAVAYCRTCGKPLCEKCMRPVRGVIYCEECLEAKIEGVPAGAAGFVSGGGSPTTISPAASGQVPTLAPTPGSGPNPAVAGILAGFFPFGVGAVYTGQYAKGLAHLAIFGLLIAGASYSGNGHSEALGAICGFGIAFFWVYQIIDAVRSARALQAGLPAPDPYGLGATFGGGSKVETSKVPIGAIMLILLGVLFLLHTLGQAEFLDRFWPVILIVLGVWMFARNWGLTGACAGRCGCARCRTRRMMGPAIVFTLGVLFLLDTLNVISFWHGTWPVILLVIGVVKLIQSSASTEGHNPSLSTGACPSGGQIPPAPPVPPVPPVPPTGEVNHG
jgi:hypothetical protein